MIFFLIGFIVVIFHLMYYVYILLSHLIDNQFNIKKLTQNLRSIHSFAVLLLYYDILGLNAVTHCSSREIFSFILKGKII